MNAVDDFDYLKRHNSHEHHHGSVYEAPGTVSSGHEVRQLVSLCRGCSQILVAAGLYLDAEQVSVTDWMTTGDAVKAAWKARDDSSPRP